MNVRILDCDGSVVSQPFAAELMAFGAAAVVDARALGPKLRIVAERRALAELRECLKALPKAGNEIFFMGSGDFHHLTVPLLERLDEDVVVVHFDNHPDWVRFPNTLNCGSWVCRALALPQVSRVITIGPSGSDLSRPQFKFANLAAIRSGRLELYAWQAEPTRLFGRSVDGPGVATEGGRLVWRNLRDEAWPDFVAELCGRLAGKRLWITFDKDVLSTDEAITNWDQGELRLNQVLLAIEALARNCPISGIDICGDYSPPRFHDLFRRFLSWTDRPTTSPSSADVLRVNDATNRIILNRLASFAGWHRPVAANDAEPAPPKTIGANH